MNTNRYAKKALAQHKKLKGKISITPKAPVKNKEDLSIFYTPGVGAVSSYLAQNKGEVGRYTLKGNTVAVVSDGSAVLGLGNIGPEGALPVMEGKCMLFKALAGVDAFPIVLATQSVDEIVDTVKHIAPVFGGINLEDIAAPKCFEVEARLQKVLDIPVFHDDQHGTALVVLAGLINACTVAKHNLKQSRVVINGAGAAGQAIARLLLLFGVQDIVMVDSQGIIGPRRRGLDVFKKELLRITNPRKLDGDLMQALQGAEICIGVSKAGAIIPQHIQVMAPRPIVFALANPIPEIMPEEAKRAGVYVMATGRSDFPNQINNSLGFPGIFRGALDHGVKHITESMLVAAAKNLARLVPKPTIEQIIPDNFDPRVVKTVAKAIR
ncbi:MAG: NADP-dependent malic enzyme [Candidatus Moraniibacteriota bacterium]|nr:MAG: NADP-dependent malic enzyme [Candidatus Moranbacteria bacterium]